ncbi:MAG: regulatory protein [Thermoanaerobaculia bacterium]|nr:regulatory protein [Thermoanaerobaculia bacterium]MEA2416290.1 regulatory protein [Thermoanaerobaculia bacterium]
MPDDLERCYIAGLRILNYRFNSEAELRAKLDRKEFPHDAIDAAIERLRREKWLDDGRFAAAFVRMRLRKGIGRLRIKRELQAAGVESATIAQALDVPDHDDRAAAIASARKRLAVLRRRDDDDAIRQKLIAYLFRQGYDSSLAVDVVREAMAAGRKN